MKNWFTTHSAHPTPDWIKWNIYLQTKYEQLASEIEVGDKVFFYETKTTKDVRCKGSIGKMALVHIGYVTGPAHSQIIEDSLSEYNDGERKSWGVEIPTDAGKSKGLVLRAKVVEVLNYANNYYFKGFARGKGIKQINDEEANALQTLF